MATTQLVLTSMAVVAMLTTTMACSTPLSLRGARVMEQGELEVIASPQVTVDVLSVADGHEPPPGLLFAPELSARFGIADRVDLQLRVDQSILPEVSAGYQLVGDPTRDDDFALTVTGGLKPSWLLSREVFLSAPVQLLAEVPLNDDVALTGGVRVVAGAGLDNNSELVVAVSPGVTAGLRWRVGPFVFHPELGVATALASGDYRVQFITPTLVPRPLLAASFGLNVGGVFDFREPTVER